MQSYDEDESSDNSDDDNNGNSKAKKPGLFHTTTTRRRDLELRPPLPLFDFKDELSRVYEARTINGESLPSHKNLFGIDDSEPGEPLQDPLHALALKTWFQARNSKEINIRHLGYRYRGDEDNLPISISDHLVYQSKVFDDDWGSDEPVRKIQNVSSASLSFNSYFESGNLSRAVRVIGRETLVTARTLDQLQSSVDNFVAPGDVHQEYDLTIRNDLNTAGNIQWYYFSASTYHTHHESQQSERDEEGGADEVVTRSISHHQSETVEATPRLLKFPLRVRFNLTNMKKSDSLYNYGMKPVVFSTKSSETNDWKHAGDDICYYQNSTSSVVEQGGDTVEEADTDAEGGGMNGNGERIASRGRGRKRKKLTRNYCLSFTYTFTGPDTVYFAHAYPYTYSDLQRYLYSLEQDSRISDFFLRKSLCETIAGNRCEALTIAAKCKDLTEERQRPAIVVSARVHPGETNSSYIMHGFLEFLTSDSSEAELLRRTFVFKILPMLNPDGVIHGNYRCSLAGSDLNRRYDSPSDVIHPTIHAMKRLLLETNKKRTVLLFLDLHGHSKNKNAFLYGSDILRQPEKTSKAVLKVIPQDEIDTRRLFARVFPKVLCAISDVRDGGYFSYRDCSFGISASKKGTGRVIGWKELGIEGAYTVEASFCSSGQNVERRLLLKKSQERRSLQATDNSNNSIWKSAASSGNNNNASASKRGSIATVATNSSSNTVDEGTQQGDSQRLSSQKTNSSRGINSSHSHESGGGRLSHRGSRHRDDDEDDGDDKSIGFELERNGDEVEGRGGNRGGAVGTDYSGGDKGSDKSRDRDFLPPLTPRQNKISSSGKNGNNGINGNNSNKNSTLITLEDILKTYETAVHYTKQDLKNMGRDIAFAILHFANLRMDDAPSTDGGELNNNMYNNMKSLKSPVVKSKTDVNNKMSDWSKQQAENKKVPLADFRRSSTISFHQSRRGSAEQRGVPVLHTTVAIAEAEMLERPLLRPAVYSLPALLAAYQSCPSEIHSPGIDLATMERGLVRVKSELAIRRALGLKCPAFPGLALDDLPVESDPEGSSAGSDSDPSVDNLPASKLLGRRKMLDFKDGKSLLAALRKASNKRRKARQVTAAKKAAKLEARSLEGEKGNANGAAHITDLNAGARHGKGKTFVANNKLVWQTYANGKAAHSTTGLSSFTVKLSPSAEGAGGLRSSNIVCPMQIRTIGNTATVKSDMKKAEIGIKLHRKRSENDFFGYITGVKNSEALTRPTTAPHQPRKLVSGKKAFIQMPNGDSRTLPPAATATATAAAALAADTTTTLATSPAAQFLRRQQQLQLQQQLHAQTSKVENKVEADAAYSYDNRRNPLQLPSYTQSSSFPTLLGSTSFSSK